MCDYRCPAMLCRNHLFIKHLLVAAPVAELGVNIAEQDGEIFDEDWSLDAAIASKELHDLRIKEQQALDDYEAAVSDTTRCRAEATTRRTTLVNDRDAHEADHPDTDEKPNADNLIRTHQKKPFTMLWTCNWPPESKGSRKRLPTKIPSSSGY